MTLTPTLSDDLAAVAGVCHGFFGREGGASTGIYAHLNCGYGSGDAPDAVAENRRRVAEWMGAREPVLNSVHQIHGTTVIDLNKAWPDGRGPKADALVSRTPSVALTVLSADCAPVLFADEGAGVVGAAHAGWRGAAPWLGSPMPLSRPCNALARHLRRSAPPSDLASAKRAMKWGRNSKPPLPPRQLTIPAILLPPTGQAIAALICRAILKIDWSRLG